MKKDLISLLAILPGYARDVFNLLAREADGSSLVNLGNVRSAMNRRDFEAGCRSLEAHEVLERVAGSDFANIRIA